MNRSMIRRERKELQHPWNARVPWVPEGAQALVREGVLGSTSECAGRGATPQMDSLRSRLGFTLLELMISISMLVIIIVIISGAMRLASRSISAGEKKVEALERLRTSLSVMNAQIQSGVPLMYSDLGAQKSYFKGDRTSLQLATNYSIWGGQKGHVIVNYRVETDRSGKRSLYASEHIVGIEASKETKLLDGFDDIGFEYFQRGLTVGEPGAWVQDWTTDAAIPSKIRLYLLSGSKERLMVLPVRARPLTGGI
jgi:general secretion pathway protein J